MIASHHFSHSRSWTTIFAFLMAIGYPSVARAQISSTWNGTTGNWTNAAIWSAGVPQNGQPNPGDLYHALINGAGTLTLDANILIQQLTFNSGTISGSNSLTVIGPTLWTGGTFGGTVNVSLNGGGSFTGSNGSMRLNGGTMTLGGGTTMWTGGNIELGNGTVFTIGPGTLFEAAGNNSISGSFPSASVVNAGIFKKKGGTGTTSISNFATFTNSGSVEVDSGTLSLGAGSSTGPMTVEGGGTLRFGTNFTFGAGASLSGGGNVTFQGNGSTYNLSVPYSVTGTTTISGINGPTVNLPGPQTFPTFALDGGTLGGNGNVTINNLFTWSGGLFLGNGLVQANGGVAFTSTLSDMRLDGMDLEIGGVLRP